MAHLPPCGVPYTLCTLTIWNEQDIFVYSRWYGTHSLLPFSSLLLTQWIWVLLDILLFLQNAHFSYTFILPRRFLHSSVWIQCGDNIISFIVWIGSRQILLSFGRLVKKGRLFTVLCPGYHWVCKKYFGAGAYFDVSCIHSILTSALPYSLQTTDSWIAIPWKLALFTD